MWIVPAAVVVLGVGAFLVLRSGGADGILGGGPDNTIPDFEFTVTKAVPYPVTNGDRQKLEAPADQAATGVMQTMTALYTEAFLDPANWRDGTYDEVWPLFDGGSQAAAQRDGATLTLGTAAGDSFDRVDHPRGKLRVKVLLDRENQPSTAVAIVTFSARGAGRNGTYTEIVSTGQYFLRPTSDGWMVYAFKVARRDHETTPRLGPSGSPTAVAS